MTRPSLTAVALLALSAAGAAANADTLFETHDPFGGWLGVNGFTVSPMQSVAGRFSPSSSATLTSVGIWFMSDDWDGTTAQTVTVTFRTDTNPGTEFTSVPSDTILETWTMDLPIVGWNPQIITFDSNSHAALSAGTNYWVVVESPVPGGMSPVWCWSSEGNEFTANTDGPGTPWESGSGAAVGMTIIGNTSTPACIADVGVAGGGAGHDGMLDNNDFIAFINYFFAQNPIADMGVAGGLPGSDNTWDNNDFIAFITAFFNGCQ